MAASPDRADVPRVNGDARLANGHGPDGGPSSDWDAIAKEDDENIMKALGGFGNDGEMKMLAGFDDKELDQTGKADDAIDFEDLSDDDLASDDDNLVSDNAPATQGTALTEPPASLDPDVVLEGDPYADVDGDLDDLFGGADDGDVVLPASSPPPDTQPPAVPQPAEDEVPSQAEKEPVTAANVTDDEWAHMSWEEKVRLNFPQEEPNSVSAWVADQTQHQDPSVPIPPQNVEELVKQKFPSFEKYKVLNFRELFKEWPAHYNYKEPPKSLPPVVPNKLELEIDVDTAKLFRIPDATLAANSKRSQGQHGEQQDWAEPPMLMDLDDMFPDSDLNDEAELVGGLTLKEFATVCDDWDNIGDPGPLYRQTGQLTPPAEEDEEMDDWEKQFLPDKSTQVVKKRKYEPGLPNITEYSTSSITNFFEATKRQGRCIQLDQSDPYLLLEDMQVERPAKKPRVEEKMKRMANGQLGRDVRHRFNYSNDAEYEALTANHKTKVRALLSNTTVEHSMPAQRLAFPYYRTKLQGEFWEHHRPKFDFAKLFKHQVRFRRQAKVKRKEMKGKSVKEIFQSSKDLSLNDNSTVILFEYCEQNPILLNKFGMGSRITNYTRRKEGDEEYKPAKAELGESHVLLPQDRSPFSIFGTVDIGEVVPTLHNALFRAPVFKHEPRDTDFILGYNLTGSDAPFYYLKKAHGLQVVGQQNYYQEVPGLHARKITSANKTRMRAVCDRMAKQRPTRDIDIREVTPHVFQRQDPQNRYGSSDGGPSSKKENRIDPNDRQKMKEFYVYNKETKTWGYKEGDAPWDESFIRQQLKPEDVVLIEATQVGASMLQSAGYDPKAPSFTEDDDELGADIPLVAKLAPWQITKNFIDACQGKAMVALHGEGDPTGHGLGFSFIKTSMKGGYINAVQGPLATSADAIERERKANGGHSYNVKKQHEMYMAGIKDIWERQKTTLSDPTTHNDDEVLDGTNEDDRFNTHKASEHTPAAPMDDGRSQLSHFSQNSGYGRRKIRISRRKRAEDGSITTEHEIVEDPQVIRSYLKQRRELDLAARDIYNMKPTGDADADREQARLIEQELLRLQKNADRRQVREKQGRGKKKEVQADAGSPDPSGPGAGGTTRKCANCGQVGHIKTNKAKCPLLNGTISTENAADLGGFGSLPGVGASAN
ncbi:hypothetical protein JX266_002933 [Neoarthrinium moseri]|uniref:uncharacterized protein n=1 Tax=Neoarthrinium moseri TaxID=1658444 RepID=UPI001FDBB82E|nr:uncharacterized protein JN550_004132 [Neoarthrinium moseri]KAI1852080.1 hypothetical protein JX266_002933 [Neoarthrinium moseri]KAI1871929.1 hypothetical protein JN550_004132 [Neoarthrinium moseri]